MFIFVVKPLGMCRGSGSSRSVALPRAAGGSVCGTGRSSSGGTSRRRRGRRGGDWTFSSAKRLFNANRSKIMDDWAVCFSS
ncbi:unnamed protein product [Pleuronectes platessa]|uniref:Uncharacterized protein n=1 Tax=Pleuronectes platessa TaxID=8262 RepID=A0A9N7TZZ0_PLEPL|nr:unnamed protein product [Pleuronectes platessa]